MKSNECFPAVGEVQESYDGPGALENFICTKEKFKVREHLMSHILYILKNKSVCVVWHEGRCRLVAPYDL